MINLGYEAARNCDGISRREFIQLGAAGFMGLSLPALLASQPANAAIDNERSLILVFLWGGPGAQDTWDMKPDAPPEIRGEFKPMATNVPGIQISDQLPMLAKMADKYTIIRSATHDQTIHAQAAHYTLTGNKVAAGREAPCIGAVVNKFLPQKNALPNAVQIGERMWDTAGNGPIGQDAGFLGAGNLPFRIYNSMEPFEKLAAAITPPPSISADRLNLRRELLQEVDRFQKSVESADTRTYDAAYERAFTLVTSPKVKQAFDLSKEPTPVRERYGMTQFGQGLLMARRLVQAGVRMVQINWRGHPINDKVDNLGFDNHDNNFPRLKKQLPELDRSVSALIEDVYQRGMDKKTVVLVTGEFGRTPVNGAGGRDHWPFVYSYMITGGGMSNGRVIGASDARAQYPASVPISPEDTYMELCRFLKMDVSLTLREARIVRDSPGIPGLFS